ncbi:MAG: hypothetical protein ACYDH9_14210 [Limisphaerales bacterium]
MAGLPMAVCFTNHARRRAGDLRLGKAAFVIALLELVVLLGLFAMSLLRIR